MDTVNDPDVYETVLMKPAQIGGTEILLNIIGYFIDQDPSPILLVQPTLEISQWFSKRRLAPMLRDTPCLQGAVSEVRSKDSDNTMLEKAFNGGSLTIAGSNSPAGLASRPVRIVLNDETDRYPLSAGTEGSPIALSKKRSQTFWNRHHVEISSPTEKGASAIEAAYDNSDQRHYHVACPHCGAEQVLKWAQVSWPKGRPLDAVYVCEHCGREISDRYKPAMLAAGVWIPEKESNGVAGFHLNELYSPWVTFGQMADNFVKANILPDTLRVFINTAFAETYEVKGDAMSEAPLLERQEVYSAELPAGVLMLTAGVDVQADRLEAEVVGWGADFESWGIEYAVFWGNPEQKQVWADVDGWLKKRWLHETGHILKIEACAIDSGFLSNIVYDYVKPRWSRRIFATKGYSDPSRPIRGKPSRNNTARIRLFPIGTTAAKDMLYGRLLVKEHGPGFCHFPDTYDEEFFTQITSEKKITVWSRGQKTRTWVLKNQTVRNEALDVRILAMVARDLLKAVNLEIRRARLSIPPPEVVEGADQLEADPPEKRKAKRKRRKSKYIYRGWK